MWGLTRLGRDVIHAELSLHRAVALIQSPRWLSFLLRLHGVSNYLLAKLCCEHASVHLLWSDRVRLASLCHLFTFEAFQPERTFLTFKKKELFFWKWTRKNLRNKEADKDWCAFFYVDDRLLFAPFLRGCCLYSGCFNRLHESQNCSTCSIIEPCIMK
jgi:hypothetical protein